MKPPRIGAIDCDIHPALPALANLLPYLSDHWREMALQSGLHELETMNYPPARRFPRAGIGARHKVKRRARSPK